MALLINAGFEVRLELGGINENKIILEDKDKSIQREIAYVLPPRDDYPPNRYTVLVLFHNNLPENYIFQVYEKSINQRIGWIFPIQALLSNKHSYAENEHFLKIAYPAFINLISPKDKQQHHIPQLKEEYTLEDFYSSNSAILILDNEELKKLNNFKFENYIPSFYHYGYFLQQNNIQLHPKIMDEFFSETRPDIRSKSLREKIIIRPVSKDLVEEEFIYQLFKELLCDEDHTIIRFYLLYQIIELLIKKVFSSQFKKNIPDISSSEDIDLFELNKKLQKMTDEKSRIRLLFNSYSQVKCPELEEIFFDFFDVKDNEKKDYSLPTLLYRVRNLLVHNYRHITTKQKDLMADINFYFERIVIYLLINYKEI